MIEAEEESDEERVKRIANVAGVALEDVEWLLNHDEEGLLQKNYRQAMARHVANELFRSHLEDSKADTRNPFELFSVEDLRQLPPVGWYIENVLPAGRDTMLFGEAYAGKTFVVLDMLLSVANGLDWFGRSTVESDVCLIVGEGKHGILQRIDAWLTAHPDCSDERLMIIPAMPDIRNLAETTQLVQLFIDSEFYPQVIAWDTWSRLTVGANENDNAAMTECVTRFRHVADVFGLNTSNIAIHHAGHNDIDRPRGASAFLGAFDTLIRVADNQLTNTKQKDAETFDTLAFKLEAFGSSPAVVQLGLFESALQRDTEKRSQLARDILAVIDEEPGITLRELKRRVRGRDAAKREAIDDLVLQHRIKIESGSNNAQHFYRA